MPALYLILILPPSNIIIIIVLTTICLIAERQIYIMRCVSSDQCRWLVMQMFSQLIDWHNALLVNGIVPVVINPGHTRALLLASEICV